MWQPNIKKRDNVEKEEPRAIVRYVSGILYKQWKAAANMRVLQVVWGKEEYKVMENYNVFRDDN